MYCTWRVQWQYQRCTVWLQTPILWWSNNRQRRQSWGMKWCNQADQIEVWFLLKWDLNFLMFLRLQYCIVRLGMREAWRWHWPVSQSIMHQTISVTSGHPPRANVQCHYLQKCFPLLSIPARFHSILKTVLGRRWWTKPTIQCLNLRIEGTVIHFNRFYQGEHRNKIVRTVEVWLCTSFWNYYFIWIYTLIKTMS